jgi:hypothetical protein
VLALLAWVFLVAQHIDPKTFDHATQTRWPLEGIHGDVPCTKCHTTPTFTALPTACLGCHVTHAHRSPLFEQRPCELCHSPAYKSWRIVKLDHDTRTAFPLERGHRIACERCHTAARGATAPPARCEDCHRTKPHGVRFAKIAGGCATCHTAVAWRSPVLRHSQHTRSPLTGKHREITCRS